MLSTTLNYKIDLLAVQKCDIILFLEQGRAVDQGTYQELIEKNDRFKRIATHA